MDPGSGPTYRTTSGRFPMLQPLWNKIWLCCPLGCTREREIPETSARLSFECQGNPPTVLAPYAENKSSFTQLRADYQDESLEQERGARKVTAAFLPKHVVALCHIEPQYPCFEHDKVREVLAITKGLTIVRLVVDDPKALAKCKRIPCPDSRELLFKDLLSEAEILRLKRDEEIPLDQCEPLLVAQAGLYLRCDMLLN
ncbi:hypothetical protein T440DRAFT_484469 [Plenodomus tracheiphilus IPT5]|uniref:Uncharacterized protein n=1 Tax=Plenodomus tracheiphilus IPT5 TaxID=1408161 RepID=A0A6A7APH3_9PLEO|nr:hypothetical protein T440DRAFT_484469 [Plenodomus tracheiphilus IPT5]